MKSDEKNKLSQQNKILVFSFAAFIGLYFISDYLNKKNKPDEKVSLTRNKSADTFIPAGHVLVPVTIQNVYGVSALIDQYAFVDLYTERVDLYENGLLARNVKLIRAPLNPDQFAVLTDEDLSRKIMLLNSTVQVVLHNPENAFKNTQHSKSLNKDIRIASDNRQTSISSENLNKKVKKIPQLKIDYYSESKEAL